MHRILLGIFAISLSQIPTFAADHNTILQTEVGTNEFGLPDDEFNEADGLTVNEEVRRLIKSLNRRSLSGPERTKAEERLATIAEVSPDVAALATKVLKKRLFASREGQLSTLRLLTLIGGTLNANAREKSLHVIRRFTEHKDGEVRAAALAATAALQIAPKAFPGSLTAIGFGTSPLSHEKDEAPDSIAHGNPAVQAYRSDQHRFELKDLGLKAKRAQSAQQAVEQPVIERILVGEGENAKVVWQQGQPEPARIKAGDKVTLIGSGFGEGHKVDYSKLIVGNAIVLDHDINMYRGKLNLFTKRYTETNKQIDQWRNEIQSWNPHEIRFQVPTIAPSGSSRILVSVQKRIGANLSLTIPRQPHRLADALTGRIPGNSIVHGADVVSVLGHEQVSPEIPVEIENTESDARVKRGEATYYCYDYNIGLAHKLVGADWDKALSGEAIDPVKGGKADPTKLWGAIKIIDKADIPDCARHGMVWERYPIETPIKPYGIAGKALKGGQVTPTDFLGYVAAESRNPLELGRKGRWIGFNCASCHAQEISYESTPGKKEVAVIPGLPPVGWSMKWAPVVGLKNLQRKEDGQKIDMTQVVYNYPTGTGEFTSIQHGGKDAAYGDDQLVNPTSIPVIFCTTLLQRTLKKDGPFTNTYRNPQEPDGEMGTLFAKELQAQTAFMADMCRKYFKEYKPFLERLGVYRRLQESKQLGLIDNASEGEWMAGLTKDPQKQTIQAAPYPDALKRSLDRGKTSFDRSCAQCHYSKLGTGTDENIIPLDKVGSYMSPSKWTLQDQGIRDAQLMAPYWVNRARGLLQDAHVRTLEDLVSSDRTTEGTRLYKDYYTMHFEEPSKPGSYHIPAGTTPAQENAIKRQHYYTKGPDGNYYYDYQEMRKNFGIIEYGLKKPIPLPAAPHPYTVSPEEVRDLVNYLSTL